MVSEIFNYQNAALLAFNFHALAHAYERRKRALDRLSWNAASRGDCRGCQRVKNVVLADERHSNSRDLTPLVCDAKFCRCVVPLDVARLPIRVCGQAKGFHRTERLSRDGFEFRRSGENQYFSVRWHKVNHSPELFD